MKRERISKASFEGLLWLQQQDALRAQPHKPSERTLARAEKVAHAQEVQATDAIASVLVPADLPEHQASSVHGFGLAIKEGALDCIIGTVVFNSLSKSKLFASYENFMAGAAVVREQGMVALSYTSQGSTFRGSVSSRVLGYLVSTEVVPSHVFGLCRMEGRTNMRERIFDINLPSSENAQVMENYFDRLYGLHAGFALNSNARVEDEGAGKVELVLLRRPLNLE